MPIDYVLYDMSYANMIMYSSTLPSYVDSKKESGDDKEIDADNVRNIDKINQFGQ